jgi:hypothetical protein
MVVNTREDCPRCHSTHFEGWIQDTDMPPDEQVLMQRCLRCELVWQSPLPKPIVQGS